MLVAFLAAVFAAGPAGAQEIRLNQEDDEDFKELILPSRVLGIGLKDTKYFEGKQKVNDPNAIKFDVTLLGGGFENKLKGAQEFHGVLMPFFIEYPPEQVNQERPGILYTGAAAWKMMVFWQNTLKKWSEITKAAGGEDKVNLNDPSIRNQIPGFLKQEQNPPKPFNKGPDMNAVVAEAAKSFTGAEKKFVKEKLGVKDPGKLNAQHVLSKIKVIAREGREHKNLIELAKDVYKASRKGGGASLDSGDVRDLMEKAEHKPLPHGLGDYSRYRYWDSVFNTADAYVSLYPSHQWVSADSTKDADRYRVAVVMPATKTYLCSYIRNCTVLQGEIGGTRIALFDDNLNGVYGEVGKDSILVGERNLCLFGKHLAIGRSLFEMQFDNDAKKLILNPIKDGLAYMRLEWNSGNGAELIHAIVKSGDSYFSLIAPPEEDREEAGGAVQHLPIAVPAGKYEIVGGLARKKVEDDNFYSYVSFTGGDPSELKPGDRHWVKIGEPLSAGITFEMDGEKRIFDFEYPKGTAGETYRWFSPLPPEARMVVKGLGAGFLGSGQRKLLRMVDDGRVFMQAEIKYDDVQYNPENGPFEVTADFDPIIFPRRDIKSTFKRIDKKE